MSCVRDRTDLTRVVAMDAFDIRRFDPGKSVAVPGSGNFHDTAYDHGADATVTNGTGSGLWSRRRAAGGGTRWRSNHVHDGSCRRYHGAAGTVAGERGDMSKRVIIATSSGLLMGLICWAGAVYFLGNRYDVPQLVSIFLHRGIMGFVIGISALRMNWHLHGLLLGLVIGSLFAIYVLVTVDVHGTPMWIIMGLFPLGALYGWLIELITTRVFGLPPGAVDRRDRP